jgi:hypothetical protein
VIVGTYRLDFSLQAGELRLTGVSASNQKAPGDDAIVPAGTGFWLTVHDSSGRQRHSQILRDPRTGDVSSGAVPDQISWAFVPDPGANGFVVFHMAFPPPAQTSFNGVRVAVFALKGGGGGVLNILNRLLKVFRAPRPAVWLLIIGDGFALGDMAKFESFAADLTDRLCGMSPFDRRPELKNRIVWKPGPSVSGGGFGWKITPLPNRLLMQVDSVRVMDFVAKQLKLDPVNVVVVINDPRYGGSGGDPAVTGLGAPTWPGDRNNAIDAAIHELGHSAFALADEYDSAVQGASPAPVELNVAHDAVSVRSKWGDALDPENGPLPTDSATATAATVGMFKGAKYDPVNNYRSQLSCRMREVDKPFCAACRQVIASVLESEL